VKSKKYNGYAPSTGTVAARTAIANKYSTTEYPLTPADIIITSGCSGALAVVIEAIANEGDNLLIPRPGFSLYQTVTINHIYLYLHNINVI
jgi:tyrosine aminotransferase